MITKGYEEIHNRLITENEILRQSLATIQKDLMDIMNTKKELFFKRRKIEMGDEYKEEFDFTQVNLLNIKKELFNMPTDLVKSISLLWIYPLFN